MATIKRCHTCGTVYNRGLWCQNCYDQNGQPRHLRRTVQTSSQQLTQLCAAWPIGRRVEICDSPLRQGAARFGAVRGYSTRHVGYIQVLLDTGNAYMFKPDELRPLSIPDGMKVTITMKQEEAR